MCSIWCAYVHKKFWAIIPPSLLLLSAYRLNILPATAALSSVSVVIEKKHNEKLGESC